MLCSAFRVNREPGENPGQSCCRMDGMVLHETTEFFLGRGRTRDDILSRKTCRSFIYRSSPHRSWGSFRAFRIRKCPRAFQV